MESGIYNIVGLAKDLELEYEDITDLYTSYIDQVDEHCKKIKESFYTNDFMELKSVIHNVKGVSGNLLINDVFEGTNLMERLLKDGDFIGSKEHVENILKLLINSKDKVRESFSQVNIIL